MSIRTKSSVKNIIWNTLTYPLTLILLLFKTKLYFQNFESFIGAKSLIDNLFFYINLTDGGLGQILSAYLYKHAIKKQFEKINQIVATIKSLLFKLGIAAAIISIILALTMRYWLNLNNSFSFNTIFIYLVISSARNLISYFYFVPTQILMSFQEEYKFQKIEKSLLYGSNILEIALLYFHVDLVTIQVIMLVVEFIKNRLQIIFIKNLYPWYKKVKSIKLDLIKDWRAIMIHKLSSVILNNTDIIFINFAFGTQKIFAYSSYFLLHRKLEEASLQIFKSTFASIGNLINDISLKKEKLFSIISEHFYISNMIAIHLSVMFFIFATPFISLWFSADIAQSRWVSLVFSMFLFFGISRITILTITHEGAFFQATKICSLIEAIINLIITIIFFIYKMHFGFYVLASLIAMVSTNIWYYPLIFFKELNIWKFYSKFMFTYLKYLIYLVGLIILNQYVFDLLKLNPKNIFDLILIAIPFSLITLIELVLLSLNSIEFKDFKNRIFNIIKK